MTAEREQAIEPEPATRPEDEPLHEDVRWLAATLGTVIRRLEGEDVFRAVEDLRQACRDRRRGDPGALSFPALLEHAAALPISLGAPVARAFTLFFLLINTAEQVQRMRRRRAYEGTPGAEPQHASARWTMASWAGSRSTPRTRLPMVVPPGSRVRSTVKPPDSSALASSDACVDLPAPSPPSKAINSPGNC